MRDVDRALVELAGRQHQVFSRAQALAAGLTPSTISRRIANGQLVKIGAHALHLAGANPRYRGYLMAGLLDLGPSALVSGRAAAHLHGLDGFGPEALEFLVPRELRKRRTIGTVRSAADISALDRTNVDGLACTSVTRTVLEILRSGDVEAAGDALASGTRRRLTAPAAVGRRLRQLGRNGRAGVRAFDMLQKFGSVESGLERRFLDLIHGAGLPVPAVQQRYQLAGVGAARVDFEFLTYPIVVEVGGRRGYLSAAERRHQERRRTALQLVGKTVYFFTTEDVMLDPDYVVATLFAAFTIHRAAG